MRGSRFPGRRAPRLGPLGRQARGPGAPRMRVHTHIGGSQQSRPSSMLSSPPGGQLWLRARWAAGSPRGGLLSPALAVLPTSWSMSIRERRDPGLLLLRSQARGLARGPVSTQRCLGATPWTKCLSRPSRYRWDPRSINADLNGAPELTVSAAFLFHFPARKPWPPALRPVLLLPPCPSPRHPEGCHALYQ